MVLNPALYRALQRQFGTVRVSAPGQPFKYKLERSNRTGKLEIVKTAPSEQYNVCCPFCGDTKFRLVINHAWLTKPAPGYPMVTNFIKCYNEDCQEIKSVEFYKRFVGEVEKYAEFIGLVPPEAPVAPIPVRMPVGCRPLQDLSPDSPVRDFLTTKYNGLTADYLGKYYGACYTDEKDPDFKLSYNRIIFPVYKDGTLVGWQGRTIDPRDKKRWILSPGFRKVLYNSDRLRPGQVPIICEGITSAIACGPTGVAIFGKTLDELQCEEFAKRFTTAIVALDPETFVPDLRTEKRDPQGNVTKPADEVAKKLCERLNKYCRRPVYPILWPREILDLARRKVAKEDVKVPDAADLGMATMYQLIQSQLPYTHKGIV